MCEDQNTMNIQTKHKHPSHFEIQLPAPLSPLKPVPAVAAPFPRKLSSESWSRLLIGQPQANPVFWLVPGPGREGDWRPRHHALVSTWPEQSTIRHSADVSKERKWWIYRIFYDFLSIEVIRACCCQLGVTVVWKFFNKLRPWTRKMNTKSDCWP